MRLYRKQRLSALDSERSFALIPRKETVQPQSIYAEQQSRKEWNVPTPAQETALSRVTPLSDAPVSLTSIQSKLPGQYIEFLSSDGKQRLAKSEAPFYITTAQFNPDGNFGMQWELTIVMAYFDVSYRLSFNVDEEHMGSVAAESRAELMAAIAEQTATSPVGPCILSRGVTSAGNTWYALKSAESEQFPF